MKSYFPTTTTPTTLSAYRPVKMLPQLCARSGEIATSSGCMTGSSVPSGFCVDHTSRLIRGKHSPSESYGELFPANDATREQYLYERGFLVAYFRRPACWFGLRLPRATRRYIARTGNKAVIPAMLSKMGGCNDYEWTKGEKYDLTRKPTR